MLRLAVSFAAGFVIVAVVTTLADVYGEGPAGFIGGLPLTGPVSIVSIGVTQSPSAALQAIARFPLGICVTVVFLLFYAIPRRAQLCTRMAIALGLWFLMASFASALGPEDFATSVVISVVVSLGILFIRVKLPVARTELRPSKPSLERMISRGALGGFVVVVVVMISVVVGPSVGGVFAAAPAIWASSLYVISRARSVEFSRSLTLTFMQTGILTAIPYAIAAEYLLVASGIWLGTLFAYIAIAPFAYLAWRLANRTSVIGVKAS